MKLKNRKYLSDIGLKLEDIPEGFCYIESRNEFSNRGRMWKEERMKYGFDSRELWSLYFTIELFLFERISMYKEICKSMNIFDIEMNVSFEGDTYSHEEAIDFILESLKDSILYYEDVNLDGESSILVNLTKSLAILSVIREDLNEICTYIGKINSVKPVDLEKEVKVYGFSQKELWFFNRTLNRFLFSRIDFYNNITNNFIDKESEFTKFSYKGKEYSFQEYIDIILDGLEIEDRYSYDIKNMSEEEAFKVDMAFDIFPLSFKRLWW